MAKHIFIILLLAGILISGTGPLYASSPVFSSSASFQDKEKKSKNKKSPGEIKPANPSLLIDAKKEALIGNIKSAAEKFRNIIDRYPDDPVAYYELSRLLSDQGNFSESIPLAVTAHELNPDNAWYTLLLAELYYNTGDYENSTKLFEYLVAKEPENSDYLYQLAALYMQQEKFREVLEIYGKIEEKAGISEEIALQKEKIYRHLGDNKGAEREIKKLIEAYPRESRYYAILAEFYMAQNQQEKALEIYQKIVEIDPENAYIHMSLADFYRKKGDNEKAYEELKLGFSTPNLDIDTKVKILLSFYSINEIYNELKDQAFTLSKILIDTHPRDPKAYSIYGDLLLQDKQYPAARDTFIKVLSMDSSRYVIWEQILQLDLQLSDYNHLVEYGQRTIELFPEQPLPFLFTGIGYMQLKRYDEALKTLKTGENLVVDNSEIQSQFCMYQGDIHHARGKDDEAFQAYEKSLALKYNNPYVLNNYAYYLSLKGKDLEKAERMSKKAVELEPDNASFQDTYGWVLFMMGRYKEASVWIQKAVNNPEENPSGEVLEHYGDVLFKLDETEQALEYWKRALEKGGGSEYLQKKITDKKYYP